MATTPPEPGPVDQIDNGPRKVTRRVEVRASADDLFALLADPRRHGELDGSGTVRDTVKGPSRLTKNSTFSVKMKQYGVPYRITSRVTDFRDGRVLEWRHPMGHKWRWEFDPAADGSTTVTETFDYSEVGGLQAKMLEVTRTPQKNATGIEATLTQLRDQHAG